MIINIKLMEDYTKELESRLKHLSKDTVEVGVFNQNKHEFSSNFTYADLFAYHSQGDPSRNIPPRDVLLKAFTFSSIKSDKTFNKELKKYFSNIDQKKRASDALVVLKGLGEFYRNNSYDIFGNTALLESNTYSTQKYKEWLGFKGNNPLVMTGALRNKIAYKIGANVWEYKP